ncbi:hypothetical protein [Vitreimonas flagellata]|uniref:hypothetical protein n=1 Tax=Vitreimonas flagellata TaxID=2560861 RepID=UPI0010751855|nr:hypothetical protein [Vitreimonas flagellata]
MRIALKGNRGPRRRQAPVWTAASDSWPAPTEGWDTETPAAELPPTRAIVFDNWIPHGVELEMRRGMDAHVTGIANQVETLMPWNGGAASKLFAASNGSLYDVTSAGAVGAASLTGQSSDFYRWVNFQTPATLPFLWVCNDSAVDVPQHFNGTTWSAPTLNMPVGYTASDITCVWESKQRLFVLLGGLTAGYLDIESIAGDVTKLPLGSVFSKGGELVDGTRVSRDGGDGMEDFTAFLTSEGEVAVYAGSDPSDATDWTKVGRWWVGEPVGKRPFVDLGADVGILTRNGLVSLLAVMAGAGDVDPATFPFITARISTPVRERARIDPSNPIWQACVYPGGDLLVINGPLSTTGAQQFVRHRITGCWGRFTGWNMACLCEFNGKLYGGGIAGDVYLLDSGHDDNGEDIIGEIQWPWSSLGSRGVVKQMVKARPIVTTETGAAISMVARADYADTPPVPTAPDSTLSDGLVWGEGRWGEGRWGGRSLGARQWRTISAVGHAISIVLRARSRQSKFALNGLDMIFNLGGPV